MSAVRYVLVLLLLSGLALHARADSDDALPLSAEQLKARWHERLSDRHFVASIRLEMNLAGLQETRAITVFRDDQLGANERVMIRFDAPADLRRVALLYLEQIDRPNDYFLYQPATRRVRRLPSTIVDDDVYGIDLEFLGFGVAQTEPTFVESVARELMSGRVVYRLSERARQKNSRFERRTTWIDAESFVPLKTEHYIDDRLVLSAETDDIETIQGVATPTSMRFHKPVDDRKVSLRVESVDYEMRIPDEAFTVLNLTKTSADR